MPTPRLTLITKRSNVKTALTLIYILFSHRWNKNTHTNEERWKVPTVMQQYFCRQLGFIYMSLSAMHANVDLHAIMDIQMVIILSLIVVAAFFSLCMLFSGTVRSQALLQNRVKEENEKKREEKRSLPRIISLLNACTWVSGIFNLNVYWLCILFSIVFLHFFFSQCITTIA